MASKKLTANQLRISDAANEHFIADNEARTINEKTSDDGKTLYEKTLPSSVPSIELANAVHDHDKDFVVGTSHAFSRKSVEALTNNPTADRFTGTVGFGNVGSINLAATKTTVVQEGKEDKTIFGLVTTVETNYGNDNAGMKAVRDEFAKAAAAALVGK